MKRIKNQSLVSVNDSKRLYFKSKHRIFRRSPFFMRQDNFEFRMADRHKGGRQYCELLENTAGVFVTNTSGTLLEVNDILCNLVGYTRQEMLAMQVSDLVPEDLVPPMYRYPANAYDSVKAGEYMLRSKTGDPVPVAVNSLLMPNGYILGIVHSTKLYQDVDEALRQSQTRFSKIFHNNPTPMIITSLITDQILDINESFCKTLGYERWEIIGKTSHDLNIWSKSDSRMKIVQKLLRVGTYRNYESCVLTKSGEKRTGLFFSELMELNAQLCILTSITDITDFKKTEQELKQREQELKTLMENLPDIIARFDKNLRCVYINQTHSIAGGHDPQKLIGQNVVNMRFGDFWAPHIKKVFKTKKKITVEFDRLNNHEHRYFQSLLVPEFAEDGTVTSVLRITRDITERKQWEKEMARLDRLGLVGEMAAGIGHEVRNPLTTVRGFLQMLKLKPGCTDYIEYFDLMINEIDKASTIISEYLSLAKNKTVKLQLHNLNDIINALSPLIQADGFIDNKYLSLELAPIPPTLLDEKEIRQLILNLARNGLEAMRPGDKLTLKTYHEKNNIVLEVIDQGSGIPLNISDKIGTPFFTTKDAKTGLGLAVCYSIAERHKAKIHFKTSDTGTIFYVKFKTS